MGGADQHDVLIEIDLPFLRIGVPFVQEVVELLLGGKESVFGGEFHEITVADLAADLLTCLDELGILGPVPGFVVGFGVLVAQRRPTVLALAEFLRAGLAELVGAAGGPAAAFLTRTHGHDVHLALAVLAQLCPRRRGGQKHRSDTGQQQQNGSSCHGGFRPFTPLRASRCGDSSCDWTYRSRGRSAQNSLASDCRIGPCRAIRGKLTGWGSIGVCKYSTYVWHADCNSIGVR